MVTKAKISRERLSREDWLAKALEVLGQQGEGKLRLEAVSRALGVTKGSFYWHFESREDFLLALIDYWDVHFTRRVKETSERRGGTPEERLRTVRELVAREDLSGYDHAFDAWAAHEPGVLAKVGAVYGYRFQYIRSLFNEMGFRGIDLEMRTAAFIGLMKVESMARANVKHKLTAKRLDTEMEFFTRR